MANISKPELLSNIWAAAGVKVDPTVSKYGIGWVVETPPYQLDNWVQWRQDAAIAHFNQHGIPIWDAVTEYQGNSSYVQGSNGVIYRCLLTNTNTDPINSFNRTQWVQAFESFGSVQVVADALAVMVNNYQTLSGISNLPLARVNLQVWSRQESDARYAPLAGNVAQLFRVADAVGPNDAIPLGQLNALLQQATESTLGVMKIATNGVVAAGTNDTDAITSLKAAAVYLSKAGNLAGLASPATARSNLGLGSAAVEPATAFLRATNNLSDVPNAATARANLGITSTAIQPESYFLRSANNLSEVVNKATARTNLGLTAIATADPATVMFKADNLGGLTDTVAARANLGLGDIATANAAQFMQKTENLAGLSNVQTARNNLGLGGAATKNVFGVVGDLNFTVSGSAGGGIAYLGNKLTLQWGIGPGLGDDSAYQQSLIASGTIMNVQITGLGVYDRSVGPCFLANYGGGVASSFTVSNNYDSGAHSYNWQALVLLP